MTAAEIGSDVTVYVGDAAETLAQLPAESVDCIVTSPPYWRLRDYGHPDQLGQEATVGEYVTALAAVLVEGQRVLKSTGTLWLNLGDTLVNGELQMIPARVALALRTDGWLLVMENIWHKVTNRTEPKRNRSTLAHEQVFQFAKRRRYFYDSTAIAEPTNIIDRPQRRRAQQLFDAAGLTDEHLAAIRSVGSTDVGKGQQQTGYQRNSARKTELAAEAKAVLRGYYREFLTGDTKNRRSVWTFPAEPLAAKHCAPFPPALAERCILAGCPDGGVVLDPFVGSGTTLMVARRLGRRSVGIDLNPDHLPIIKERLGASRLDLVVAS